MESKTVITTVHSTTENKTWTLEELALKVQEARHQLINLGFTPHICESVAINKRLKKVLGRTTRKTKGGVKHYSIDFSYDYLATASTKHIMDTIAHECIHLCDGCWDHGNGFKYAACKMAIYGYDIKRLMRDEEYIKLRAEQRSEKIRYRIYCENCGGFGGEKINYTQKLRILANPNQTSYVCRTCRARKFKVIQINPDGSQIRLIDYNA